MVFYFLIIKRFDKIVVGVIKINPDDRLSLEQILEILNQDSEKNE
jgi:hypothetical protein